MKLCDEERESMQGSGDGTRRSPSEHTSAGVLQEVWACWCELLSYLEQENAFLDQLEQKLDETDSLQGGAEELHAALGVSIESRRCTLGNQQEADCVCQYSDLCKDVKIKIILFGLVMTFSH